MSATINEHTAKEGKKIIAGKIENYVCNDDLNDLGEQSEPLSLLQNSKESRITKNQLVKKEQPIKLGSKLLISLMPLLVLVVVAVIFWLFTF